MLHPHDQSSILLYGSCDIVQLSPPAPSCGRTSIGCLGQLSPRGVGRMFQGLQTFRSLGWNSSPVLVSPWEPCSPPPRWCPVGTRVLNAHGHHLPNTAHFLCCSQPSCPVSPPSSSLSDSASLNGHLHFNPCFGIYAIRRQTVSFLQILMQGQELMVMDCDH